MFWYMSACISGRHTYRNGISGSWGAQYSTLLDTINRRRDNRRWDGWMASATRWTWVWVNSGIWWWTGRPGMLQFMGSQRVGYDWATELNWINVFLGGKEAACNAGAWSSVPWSKMIPWRRKWQPTAVFLPGEFHGQRSLADYSPHTHSSSHWSQVYK